jgi:hypothetical protein
MVVAVKIAVLVEPNKSKNLVVESPEGLTVSLRAALEKGKANAALICVWPSITRSKIGYQDSKWNQLPAQDHSDRKTPRLSGVFDWWT